MKFKTATQNQAIDKCIELGKQFTEHFNKVMKEGKDAQEFNHHCSEMRTWFDKVRHMKLKTNNKYISNSKMSDWFFTVGQGVEDVILPEYVDAYEKFYVQLLNNPEKSISELIIDLMKG